MQVNLPKVEATAERTVKTPDVKDPGLTFSSTTLKAERFKRQQANAKLLFSDSLFTALKRIEGISEFVLPNLNRLFIVLDKANADQLKELASNKNVQAYVKKVESFSSATTIDQLLKTSRAMTLPKKLQLIHDSKPQWGLESGPKYSPNVMPAPVHGDELRKLQYVNESKAHFTQHLKDGLLRGQKRSKLVLETKDDKVKDTANDKMVATTSFYIHDGSGGNKHLVGRWQKGGLAWHYDRLPQKLLRILHSSK